MNASRSPSKLLRRAGFTLIEMIGVLAIIAILVAAVAPRIFDSISDSKITSATSSIKTLQSAVAKYYADVGTLYPLTAAGVATPLAAGVSNAAYGASMPDVLSLASTAAPANTGAGLWRKFRGPYTEGFTTANPPIGTSMTMSSVAAVAGALTATSLNFSLANNATTLFPANTQLVLVTIAGVGQKEFEKIDGILDEGIGATSAQKVLWGKVKWNAATSDLMIYLAHK